MSENKKKKCPYCGKQLPEESDFCLYCEKNLSEKASLSPSVPLSYRFIILLLAVFLTAAGGMLYIKLRPHTYEGGAILKYSSAGENWTLLLTYSLLDGINGNQQEKLSDTMTEGSKSVIPSVFMALTGTSVGNEEKADADGKRFMELVDTCTAEAIASENGQKMEIYGPSREPNYKGAAQVCNVVYTPESGTNEIRWTLHMKNKDTIILKQQFTCSLLETLSYHYEDVSLDTGQKLQEFCQELAVTHPDAVIELYLPPVVYEEGLTLRDQALILYGSEENGVRTTFCDTIRIETRYPELTNLNRICIKGNGNGDGVYATVPFMATDCVFENWEHGVNGAEGSWPILTSCTFTDNQTGFLFDSLKSTASAMEYENNTFTGNQTAVRLSNVPGKDGILIFKNTTWEKNGTNIDNASTYVIQEE